MASIPHPGAGGARRATTALRGAAAAMVAAAAAACAAARTGQPAPRRAEYALAGAAPEVHVVAGSVRVEPGPGPGISVRVRRLGRDSAVLAVHIRRDAGGDALWVVTDSRRLLYPGMRRPDSAEVRAARTGFRAARRGLLTPHTTVITGRGARGDSAHADVLVRVPAGHRLRVDVGAGEIVAAGTAADLRLTSVAAPVTAERTRGPLRVETEAALAMLRRVEGDVAVTTRRGGASLDSVAGPRLTVRSSAGSVTADRLLSSDVALHVDAGSVDLRGVHAARLRIDTHAGSLAGRDLHARWLEVETGAGPIELRGVRSEDAVVHTGAGDLGFALAGDVRSLRLKADGSIRLELPPGLDADLRLRGDDGIQLAVPARVLAHDGPYVLVRLGSGRGRLVADADDRLSVVGAAARE